jgi:hypothetical protein
MHPIISNLANSMKPNTDVKPWDGITSVHFRQRARNYRLAAAIADNPYDVAMFSDLDVMFDCIANSSLHIEAECGGRSNVRNLAHRLRRDDAVLRSGKLVRG